MSRTMPLADVLLIRVQPRASSNRIVVGEAEIKIYTTSPPVDGEANEAVVSQLAKALKVSQSQVIIVSGHTSRTKRVRVEGMASEDVRKKLTHQQK